MLAFLDDVIRFCLNDLFSYFDYDIYHAYTLK
jgi:polyphosphate kinase